MKNKNKITMLIMNNMGKLDKTIQKINWNQMQLSNKESQRKKLVKVKN